MNFYEVFILSLIEGLTEFIPVSSTGHLILVGQLLKLEHSEFLKAFDVIIQFGAILAVIFLYHRQFLKIDFQFYKKLLIGFIPAGLIGFFTKDLVAQMMESTNIVAWSLILGGVFLIFADKLFKKSERTEVTMIDSFKVGFFQCLALIPGVSRSGATIVGAQALGISKEKAAEFSFFLAVPTMAAATLYKTWKIRNTIETDQIFNLSLGVILSFLFAVLAIKFFITLVKRYGFRWFGVYRILLGILVLLFFKT
jgi:undecaprenyl-diphosphatase